MPWSHSDTGHRPHPQSQTEKQQKNYPLQKHRTFKDAMWETSHAMPENDIHSPPAAPANPLSDEELLTHMIIAIGATTKQDSQAPPSWITLHSRKKPQDN